MPLGALLALMGGACLIGLAPILVRLAEAEALAPTASAFWRLSLAAPILVLLSLVFAAPGTAVAPHGRKTSIPARTALWLALGAGVMFAGDLATWHAGIVRTTAANATLLANLTPVLVVAFAWLVLKERVRAPFLLGGLIALAGAAVLTGPSFSAGPRQITGDLLCLATTLWYAAYLLMVRAARGRMTALRVMTLSTLAGAPLLLPVALAFGEAMWPASTMAWVWAGLLGLVHVGGQGGVAYGLGRLPASLSSVALLVQPVVAAIFGHLIFGDPLGAVQVLGGALVLCGVIVAQRAAPATSPPPGPRGAAPLTAPANTRGSGQ